MAYAGYPITVFEAISATPTAPYEILLSGQRGFKLMIEGTNTARTIEFKAKLTKDGNANFYGGYSHNTGTLKNTTTTKDEFITFDDLRGLYSLIISPTVITGGNLTITAKWY